MRRANLRPFVDMAKNAEMEIGIFIKDRPFDLSIWAEMLGYKLWISAGIFGVMGTSSRPAEPGSLSSAARQSAANWSSV